MRQLEEGYIELKSKMADMSSIVRTMIQKDVKALVERNSELADEVIAMDDDVDLLDIQIDELASRLLALYEPKAIDFRFLTAALRIIVDVERIGDHCVDIAKEVKKLNKIPQIKPYIDLPRMAEACINMLDDSIAAYFKRDEKLALEVIKRDDFVDSLNEQVLRELFTYVTEDPRKINGIISLMFLSKSFERIADYTTNICEDVYFMVKGDIIRHRYVQEKAHEKDFDSRG